jgi:hypothetical protein
MFFDVQLFSLITTAKVNITGIHSFNGDMDETMTRQIYAAYSAYVI